MAESSSGKKAGRPRKMTVQVTLELTQQQDLWLNDLVDSGCHGANRESILETWIAERFRQLRDAGELRRTQSSFAETNIVELEARKTPALSDTGKAAGDTDRNQDIMKQTAR